MGTAVVALFDEEATARVRALCRRLADAQLSARDPFGYRPHLTLAVARDVPAETVAEAIAAPLGRLGSFDLWLNGVATFASGPNILYLTTTVSPALTDLQRTAVEAVADLGVLHEHSRFWTPHVTLANDLRADMLPAALQLVGANFLAFRARVTAVEIVRMSPVSVVRRISLAE